MAKDNYRDLTEGSVPKVLIRFTIPFLLSGLLQMAYSTVDVYFLGHFASAGAVAGAAQGVLINIVLTSFFMGLTSGGAILLGQFIGAKDPRGAASTLGNMIIVGASSAVLATIILLLGTDTIIRLVDTPAEAVLEAHNYLFVCSCGLTFIIGYNLLSSVLRALGDSKAPFVFVLISTCLNIVLDYSFVGPLGLGAMGAALATVISQAFSFVLGLCYLVKKGLPFPFAPRDVRPQKVFILRILKVGLPVGLQGAANNLSFVFIGRIINSMGVYAAAASSVVNTLTGIILIIPMSAGMSISAITAQNIGSGKTRRATSTLWYGIGFCLCIAVPFALIMTFFPQAVVGIISSDANVIRESVLYLYPFAWDLVFATFVFTFNGFFNGCGKTLFAMLQEILSGFCVRFPVAWAFKAFLPGATMFHIGLATPLASIASMVACLIYYRSQFSKERLEKISADIAGHSADEEKTCIHETADL